MPKRLKKKRESRDVNQLARQLVDRTTAEPESEPALITPAALSAYMSALGAKGGRISGAKRMQNLSEATRSEIALRAANARWDKERELAKKKRAK